MLRRFLPVLFALGCSASQMAAPPPPPAQAAIAPPPFTAAQIRDATRVGRTYRFRVESAGEPLVVLQLRFTAVDETGSTRTREAFDEQGNALKPAETIHETWAELQAHASWPAESTTRDEAEIDVPAGHFRGPHYVSTETKEGATTITRAWFAGSLPGAPVRLEMESGGQIVMRMTLLSHEPGP